MAFPPAAVPPRLRISTCLAKAGGGEVPQNFLGWPRKLLVCYYQSAGWSSLVARWAHNPKVEGSNPSPATNLTRMSRVSNQIYFVYVLWSASGRCFYIAISDNPPTREEQHNRGTFKSWSKRHRPWTVVFTEKHPDYRSARKREIELKAQKGGRGFFVKTGLDPELFGR